MSRRNYDLLVFAWDRVLQKKLHKNIEVYKKDYKKSIRRVQDMQPGATCLVLGPTFQGRIAKSQKNRRAFAETERAHREIAQATDCAYFSLAEAMGGIGNIRKWEGQGWTLPGGTRFSESGYTHLADKLTKDLFLLFDRERFERQRADATSDPGPTRFAALNTLWKFFQD